MTPPRASAKDPRLTPGPSPSADPPAGAPHGNQQSASGYCFHGCRSGTASDRAGAGAWSSSVPIV
jgi:hypothetical protein